MKQETMANQTYHFSNVPFLPSSGQMNQQRHFHAMHEIRDLAKPIFKDHLTCLLTTAVPAHVKQRKVSIAKAKRIYTIFSGHRRLIFALSAVKLSHQLVVGDKTLSKSTLLWLPGCLVRRL